MYIFVERSIGIIHYNDIYFSNLMFAKNKLTYE